MLKKKNHLCNQQIVTADFVLNYTLKPRLLLTFYCVRLVFIIKNMYIYTDIHIKGMTESLQNV